MAKIATLIAVSVGLVPLVAFPSAPAFAAPKVHTMIIDKMKFGAIPTVVAVGDVILWVNKDMFRHSATASDRSFDVDLPPGARGKIVLKRAGTIRFYCRYHPGMKGNLTVR